MKGKWKDYGYHILAAFVGITVLLWLLETPTAQSMGAGMITKIYGVGS